MLPRWGTLLTYGRALVMRILRSPFLGRIGSDAMVDEKVQREGKRENRKVGYITRDVCPAYQKKNSLSHLRFTPCV